MTVSFKDTLHESPPRVRFAPSPTGYLHVGGARTALYNYLLARRFHGQFILRIEDTDVERNDEVFLQRQLEDLMWLGLKWDEGINVNSYISFSAETENPSSSHREDPHTKDSHENNMSTGANVSSLYKDKGPYGPYRQSQRLPIYKKWITRLLQEGKAYHCFLSDEEISAQKQLAKKLGKAPKVESPYREWDLRKAEQYMEEVPRYVVRFRVSEIKKSYFLKDLLRGPIEFSSDIVGDFVLIRSDGFPVYNFCCAVDDALMKITHVLRAEEHLPNTLRQLMVYESLDFKPPHYAHLSIIQGEDRQKLSKRHGAVSCQAYARRGILPSALCNFLSLLGWSSPDGQEILEMEKMIQNFSIERLHRSAAVFDEKKLLWMNSKHLRNLSSKTFWIQVNPFLKAYQLEFSDKNEAWKELAFTSLKNSFQTLDDAAKQLRPFCDKAYKLSKEAQELLIWPSVQQIWQLWQEALQKEGKKSTYLDQYRFKTLQQSIQKQTGLKGTKLFKPLRVAILGHPQGIELSIAIALLSISSLSLRVSKCLQVLESK